MELIIVMIAEMALRGSKFQWGGAASEDYAGFYFNLWSIKLKSIGTPSVPSVKKYSAKILKISSIWQSPLFFLHDASGPGRSAVAHVRVLVTHVVGGRDGRSTGDGHWGDILLRRRRTSVTSLGGCVRRR